MEILIPSRGRPDKQVTAQQLHEAGIPFTIVRTYGDETVYPHHYKQIVCPPEVQGLTPKREWMLQTYGRDGKYFTIDDDMKFFWVNDDGKPRPATSNDLRRMVKLVEDTLDSFAHVGMADRFRIHEKPKPFMTTKKITAIAAYNTKLFPDPWPRFRTQLLQDIDFTLQLLTQGRDCAIVTDYCWSMKRDTEGGCRAYRTPDLRVKCQDDLVKMWDGIVRHSVLKSGWVTFAVQWKKALHNYGSAPCTVHPGYCVNTWKCERDGVVL